MLSTRRWRVTTRMRCPYCGATQWFRVGSDDENPILARCGRSTTWKSAEQRSPISPSAPIYGPELTLTRRLLWRCSSAQPGSAKNQ
ncbi:hypothetical protein M6B38_171260 [Iris pallida]|uniref:Uncharacterized protein n=1 Tax=Iris pallida TaxID=29817 RepID=A0AAX6EV63_IRIPA|nr:hypothetical protein M6B38_171260 [Iris pallida]